MQGVYTGTVKFFNTEKGFGFISSTDPELISQLGKKDLFFHISAVPSDMKFTWEIKDGDEVEFTVTDGKKGPQAGSVKPIVSE